MTNEEIKNALEDLIQNERNNTKELLIMLTLAAKERSYLQFGYANLFAWLTEGFKYSASCAQRRLNSIKVLAAVPEAQASLLSGDLNLTNMNRAQTFFNAQEQVTGTKVTDEQKAEALKNIENKKEDEAHKALLNQFPEAAKKVQKPKRRRIDAETTRCTYDFTNQQMALLERVREVWSHKFPKISDEALVEALSSYMLKKEDLLEQPDSGRDSQAQDRRDLFKEAMASCTYKDPVTGKVCGCRFQPERDHIQGVGIGGDDSRENSRLLCRAHNGYMADITYGKEHMDQYRN